MSPGDLVLSKEQIKAKYPTGSPDYPTHPKECGCSGCYSSWGEWRGAHAGVTAERARIVAILETRIASWRAMRTEDSETADCVCGALSAVLAKIRDGAT
jgi:hypothetical protein